MPGTVGERVGHNESVLREINERIESGRWRGEEPGAFRCECASLRCTELVELTLAEYEEIRSHSRWFLLSPGHELEGQERVIRRADGHIVVEKIGDAGKQAAAEDPRHGASD